MRALGGLYRTLPNRRFTRCPFWVSIANLYHPEHLNDSPKRTSTSLPDKAKARVSSKGAEQEFGRRAITTTKFGCDMHTALCLP